MTLKPILDHGVPLSPLSPQQRSDIVLRVGDRVGNCFDQQSLDERRLLQYEVTLRELEAELAKLREEPRSFPPREWQEAMVAPIWSDCSAANTTDIVAAYSKFVVAEGTPDTVWTYSVEHALALARIRWPMAHAWRFVGFTNPEDSEYVKDDSPRAIQRLGPVEYVNPPGADEPEEYDDDD